ncbi:ribose 5-phosphate isomerase B [Melittangium boletus]|uniref:Ribose 5-phosphate isomerase B n=1 Tax=Melittangium boletus DSM 14713 TaxID=1294270 RepID=A0A250IMU4_9BACT|nr:ribose 5-phosphate isomerase B [Melittangium boletus]ATB32487.1 ribose 5-phosphate isomerase B [Melittangium boletus DSM 14713]
MKVIIASDHAGLELRRELVKALQESRAEVDDLGPATAESVDYPDFARQVALAVAEGRATYGVLVCGTGMGMAITANKFPGIRAALCTDEFVARMSRAHNDANVLCLGQRVVGPGLARSILDAFLATPFEGGRHQRRLDKIREAESGNGR